MSRLSPAGLLLVGAFLVPVAIEVPVVLAIVGVDLPMPLSFGLGVVAFALIFLWSELTEPSASSTES